MCTTNLLLTLGMFNAIDVHVLVVHLIIYDMLSKGARSIRSRRALFPKEAPEVPEGSNLFLNVLREASPLAAFRRKRTCFEKSTSFGFLREASPLAAFLRKRQRFPKEATCFEKSASFGFLNVLREASPLAGWRLSEGSRRKRTCFRPSASSRRKGVLRFLREASPLALPSESFTSGGFPKDVYPSERRNCLGIPPSPAGDGGGRCKVTRGW